MADAIDADVSNPRNLDIIITAIIFVDDHRNKQNRLRGAS